MVIRHDREYAIDGHVVVIRHTEVNIVHEPIRLDDNSVTGEEYKLRRGVEFKLSLHVSLSNPTVLVRDHATKQRTVRSAYKR